MRTASLANNDEPPSVWSFDALFPKPFLDERSVMEDLYGAREREEEIIRERRQIELDNLQAEQERVKMELERREGGYLVDIDDSEEGKRNEIIITPPVQKMAKTSEEDLELTRKVIMGNVEETDESSDDDANVAVGVAPTKQSLQTQQKQRQIQQQQQQLSVDKTLTRLVEDRIYGLTRSPAGSLQYSTSLLDSSRAVQFREGVRLGKALTINIDRLCHFAKKDLRAGRKEEAQEYYLQAIELDPTDGRPYLGLSRIAERRGDLEHARGWLKEGIAKCSGGYVDVKGPGKVNIVESKKKKKRNGSSSSFDGNNDKSKSSNIDFEEKEGSVIGSIPDLGPNPFLLQALGTLEQKSGNLATAEELYLQAIRSRPSHAAAWVALAQLRTKELRQGAAAGRACYQSAERELSRIGAKPNTYVYTAWATMEYKKGSASSSGRDDDVKSLKRARELYQKALDADPHCSVAYLQLGVMESAEGNYDRAKECFEKVLTFDQRNSRVLQAYAIMESRREEENVNSRRVLDLFERALKANPRDAGVYQAYGLYVEELGDVESARDL